MFGPLLREFSNEYVRIFLNFFLFTFHSYFIDLIPLSCFYLWPFREVSDYVCTYPVTVWTVINDKSHQILQANSFPTLKLSTIRTSFHPESVSQERLQAWWNRTKLCDLRFLGGLCEFGAGICDGDFSPHPRLCESCIPSILECFFFNLSFFFFVMCIPYKIVLYAYAITFEFFVW